MRSSSYLISSLANRESAAADKTRESRIVSLLLDDLQSDARYDGRIPICSASSSREAQHVFGFFKRRRRNRLRAAPFPADWLSFIEKNVRFYDCLPEADRRELQGLVQVLLAEKIFEGCGGLVLTDEIKVTIAAQACLLLLHRDTDIYPKLTTILVYPSAYVAKAIKPVGSGLALEGENVNLGESWTNGIVVLSWDDVLRGCIRRSGWKEPGLARVRPSVRSRRRRRRR